MKGDDIMSYSIYDSFLTVADCKYYCNQIAKKLNLNTYDYFYDKSSEIQFPGDSNIKAFQDFKSYEDWRIRFNLTIKGFRFLYVCKFYNQKDNGSTAIDS